MELTFALLAGIDGQRCADDRFPILAGQYVLFCAMSTKVDRVRDLRDGRDVPLRVVVKSPVWSLEDRGLTVASTGAGAERERVGGSVDPFPALSSLEQPIAAAAGGLAVALSFADRIEVSWDGGPNRTAIPARPLPGQLAVTETFAAWIERDQGADTVHAVARDGRKRSFAGDGRAVFPVGMGEMLAWADGEGVEVFDWNAESSAHVPAETGFLHPVALAVFGGKAEVCFEDRAGLRRGNGGISVRCSGGAGVSRTPNELAPSLAVRDGVAFLLFHEDGQVWLAAMPGSAGPP